MKRSRYILAFLILLLCTDLWAIDPSKVNVVILGDSNSWIGGDDCSKPKGWNTWFKRAFAPASCRSYARSGATWSHTSATKVNPQENIGIIGPDNVISNQVVRLRQAVASGSQTTPDLIIIAAGTNDLMFPRKRPGATAAGSLTDLKTVAGAMNADLRDLHNFFPKTKIVVLTPIQCVKFTNQALHSLSDLMETTARSAGANVVRMDRQGVVKRDDELKKKTNTYDGIHTSEAGAKANGELVASIIKKLLEPVSKK